MPNCPSCGGVVGRDCFNPEECAWIGEQQERQARQEQEQRAMGQEEELAELRQELHRLSQRVSALERNRNACC